MCKEIIEDHARYDHVAVTRVWAALGITEYTGKSVDEHVVEVVAENAALREQLAEAHAWIDRKNAAIETWQQQAKEYATRLAQVEKENERLSAIVSAYENQDEEALEEAENL